MSGRCRSGGAVTAKASAGHGRDRGAPAFLLGDSAPVGRAELLPDEVVEPARRRREPLASAGGSASASLTAAFTSSAVAMMLDS